MTGKPPTETFFRVGDVFDSQDELAVRAMQFILSAQPISALARLLRDRSRTATADCDTGSALIMSLAITKEAVELFLKADNAGLFSDLAEVDGLIDAADLQLARNECSKEPGSLYETFLYDARHQTVHWKFTAVGAALAGLQGAEYPVWAGGETYADGFIPLADKLAQMATTLYDRRQQEEVDAIVSRLTKLQGALIRLAEAIYVRRLLRYGVLRRPDAEG